MAASTFRGHRGSGAVRGRRRIEWSGYLYILPSLFVVTLVTLYPVLRLLWLMVHDVRLTRPGQTPFVGLEQFREAMSSPVFWVTLRNTFVFSISTIAISVVLGFLIALLVGGLGRGKTVYRAVFITPLVLAPIVVGVIWKFLYNPALGVIDYVLGVFGVGPVDWLGNPHLALTSVVLVVVWQWTPYAFLVFLAGIESLDPTLYEAASIDGANGWQEFASITLPLLRPLVWIIVMFRFVWSFRTFDIIYALTQGGPGVATQTLSIRIFQQGFQSLNLGYASALSFVMLIITMLGASFFVWRFVKGLD